MAHEPRGGEGRTREPYHRAARFGGNRAEGEALRAYERSCYDLACSRPETDISVYRMEIGELIGRVLTMGWYVALIGQRPDKALERRLERNLATGEPMELPEEVTDMLEARHHGATTEHTVYLLRERDGEHRSPR